MKLEAVTVCRDYADFLAWTLPGNSHLFDRMVVVTSREDTATQRLCEYHHVTWVTPDTDRAFGQGFNKGAAINVGLQHLDCDAWVVHLDADISLPPQTRQVLETLDLDPAMLYGIDRHLFRSAKEWRDHIVNPKLQHEMGVYVHTQSYPVATRFFLGHEGGYIPIGFFQLWNPQGSGVYRYPDHHNSAGRTDMLFAIKWPRRKRAMLPEVVAYHLESEEAQQGANWEGRTTASFDPDLKPWHRIRRWWHHHRHHRDDDDDPPCYDTAIRLAPAPRPSRPLWGAVFAVITVAAILGMVAANLLILSSPTPTTAWEIAKIGACLAIDGGLVVILALFRGFTAGLF